jgi:membrane protein
VAIVLDLVRRYAVAAFRVVWASVSRLNVDDGWAMASHLALAALMAMFPFLIFVAALAGFIGEADLADRVTDLLFQTWPKEIATPIAREVHNVLTGRRGDVLTISIVITIYLASNGVEAVRAALNRAYGSQERRFFLLLRLQSILFVLIGALASLVLAILGVLGPLIWSLLERWLPWLEQFRLPFILTRYAVVGGVLTLALVSAHLWLPYRRPPGMRIWPGIALTLALWWLATTLLAAYLQTFADYGSTYAGLASVVATIFFLYVMAVMLILGAEFNAALARAQAAAREARRRHSDRPLPPSEPPGDGAAPP